MDFRGMYRPSDRYARAIELLDLVGMADQAQKLPSAISGGQQQRVAIARALANDPPILIADEPTGNLDSRTADSVFELFESLVSRGKTILVVTHDNDLAKRVTRTIILSDGEVIEQYLARTFPALDEEHLVLATRRLQIHKYDPGALIISHGDQPDNFYIITKGKVEVFITGPYGQELLVASMQAGQYFGEVELLAGGTRIATVRAGHDTGVEVAAIDASTFRHVTDESEQTLRDIQQTVRARIEENRSASEQVRGQRQTGG
jgi:ABC-type multidrug transport system ATPase subunit